MSNIEKSSLQYSFLFLLPFALVLLLFSYVFYAYLYIHEVLLIVVFSVASIFISLGIGGLYIHTRATEDRAMIGKIQKLKFVRNELDKAMENSRHIDGAS